MEVLNHGFDVEGVEGARVLLTFRLSLALALALVRVRV